MCSKGLGAKARIETNADFTANTGLIASIGIGIGIGIGYSWKCSIFEIQVYVGR